MTKTQIEAWAIGIIERVLAAKPNEDDLVELKSNWIPPNEDAARRIAGHLNAARGAPVLWLIGVDEKKHTAPGASENELANWFPQVCSHIHGDPPTFRNFVIRLPDGTGVVALLFDSDRAPFLINLERGRREVPWREGNAVRSSTHYDLIKMLVPIAGKHEWEIFGALVSRRTVKVGRKEHWRFAVGLYIIPVGSTPVIMRHKCKARVQVQSPANEIGFTWLQSTVNKETATISESGRDLVINGPGELIYQGRVDLREMEIDLTKPIMLHVVIGTQNQTFERRMECSLSDKGFPAHLNDLRTFVNEGMTFKEFKDSHIWSFREKLRGGG